MGEIIQMERQEQDAKVLAFAGYREFEEAADRTAVKIKEGFMEMGCILKIARDTDILSGSGYRTVEEFAERRYDLDKGTVSRYIRIVERFSVDGESNRLKESYKNMGFAKLSLMLHMPDAVAEELMDSLSKSEVAAIKEEIDAEAAISDIEVAIEKASLPPREDAEPEDLLTAVVRQLGKEQRQLYRKVWTAVETRDRFRMVDSLAPQGDQIYMVRIQGTGRVMLSLSGTAASVTVIRSGEKKRYRTVDVVEEWEKICPMEADGKKLTAEEAFYTVYGETLGTEEEKSTEVAPVQPKKEKRKESKVVKANPRTEKKKEPAAAVTQEAEEQLPGQMNIGDYPGTMPDKQASPDEMASPDEPESPDKQELPEEQNVPELRYEEIGEVETDAAAGITGADAGEGCTDGRYGGKQDTDGMPAAGLPEHYAGNGAAEEGGREEDPDVIDGKTEEKLWMEAYGLLQELDSDIRFVHDVRELAELHTDYTKELYRRAVDLAAALERITILRALRESRDGKEHYAQ